MLLTINGNKFYFHGGVFPGFSAFFGYDPINKITIVTWTNLPITVNGSVPASDILISLLREIYMGEWVCNTECK